ncbi:hypothetical protein ABMA27_002154 [Loxostege sticticalis]|uniref:SKI/SNO/DAC domain-containing protein n=1 Tax=Loxostege sticticalis TaxID=481309 RepID=A0ABR3HWS6_LOXSC
MESAVDSASTASEVSGSSGGSPRVKAASPARAMSPPQLLAPRLPLPPPGLGLLGSLQMMHHSPLELMAAAHHHGPPRYGSPPPISTSDPSANECKLVDYRGQKVAAFIIQGDTMLCLPQAFELFLKHLVGGLHTVYTKLKRLDIVPLVCNVEQVRILRGLGAIQPGVNRCKLLSCKDFDVLYRDCTTARRFDSRDSTFFKNIAGNHKIFTLQNLINGNRVAFTTHHKKRKETSRSSSIFYQCQCSSTHQKRKVDLNDFVIMITFSKLVQGSHTLKKCVQIMENNIKFALADSDFFLIYIKFFVLLFLNTDFKLDNSIEMIKIEHSLRNILFLLKSVLKIKAFPSFDTFVVVAESLTTDNLEYRILERMNPNRPSDTRNARRHSKTSRTIRKTHTSDTRESLRLDGIISVSISVSQTVYLSSIETRLSLDISILSIFFILKYFNFWRKYLTCTIVQNGRWSYYLNPLKSGDKKSFAQLANSQTDTIEVFCRRFPWSRIDSFNKFNCLTSLIAASHQ